MHEAGGSYGKPHARKFDSSRGHVEETNGYVGALCAAFSLGAILAGIIVTLVYAIFFEGE